MLTLKADKRDTNNKLDKLRIAGQMPAVFYGKKEASTPISITQKDFLKAWREAGESSVIKLETPDGSKESLIHDVDLDPVSGLPRHADFYVFEKGHKLEIDIPLEFIGVSSAVKDKGGVLVKVLHELKIKADPSNLPHELNVDISSMEEIEDHILAKDITLPTGVELVENPEEVVTLVSAQKEEEVESAPADLSSIEVEKKGKEDSDEESAEGDTSKPEESKEA